MKYKDNFVFKPYVSIPVALVFVIKLTQELKIAKPHTEAE